MAYIARMEFSDYMLIKAIVLVVLAFVWGLYCGFTDRELNGQPQQPAQRDKAAASVRSE